MPTTERVTLKFTRYRDPEGNPTCSSDSAGGETCYFYVTGRCGTHEMCVFHFPEGEQLLRRGEDGLGYLVPSASCPMWGEEEVHDEAE